MVARLAVNEKVVGSNPTRGAKEYDTNSLFLGEIVFSRSAFCADAPSRFGGTGLFLAARFSQFSL